MAAQGENEQAEAAGASDEVWPPPPTCEPPEAAPPRRLLLPLYMVLPQMPKGFGLPKWAKSASFNIMLVLMVFWLERDAPLVGKVLVGSFALLISICLFASLYWTAAAISLLVSQRLGSSAEALPSEWLKDKVIPAMGGWMGLPPNVLFLVWGLSYLGVYPIHKINRVALIGWAAWFVMGCVVAVVNGVRQWLRNRRTPPGTGDGKGATG